MVSQRTLDRSTASSGLRPRSFIKGTKALVIKAFDETLFASIREVLYILKERKQYRPEPDHPWRKKALPPRVLETHIAKSREEY